MVKIEDIYEAYHWAHKQHPRGIDAVEFAVDSERRLSELCQAINDRTFEAANCYTFITYKPRVREIWGSKMDICTVQWYLHLRINPLIEKRLTARTFNNRIGMGGDAAINQVVSDIYEVSHGFTRDAWIIKWDVQSCFPHILHRRAYGLVAEIIESEYDADDKDDLLYILRQTAFMCPTLHAEQKSPPFQREDVEHSKSLYNQPDGQGAMIGSLFWQTVVNLYMNNIDHLIVDDWGLKLTRFVDDSVLVIDNKEAGLALVPIVRSEYEKIGLRLHPNKFSCQHYTKGVEFLGSHIKMDRLYLNNRTVNNAFQRLRELKTYHADAAKIIPSVNSYLGMMKRRNAYGIARNYIEEVLKHWNVKVDYQNLKINIL